MAREVGTDGKLGGQAQVPGVGGTWKDLTDSVNSMASNLTGQVRNIAEVATAIASGDLSKKITVNVSGEILLLKDTINTMVDQLNDLCRRGDARRPRSGIRGQVRGTGQRPWRGRYLERPYRLSQFNGRKSDCSGAQHCRGDHRRRAWRSVTQDHGRR